jgi:hypothetical protein
MKKIALWLGLVGLLGAASLALVPIERLVPGPQPMPLPLPVLRLLTTLQPALLVLAATALGAWAAPKVRLDAPLIRAAVERRPMLPVLRGQLPPAVVAGVATAVVLVAYSLLTRSLDAAPLPFEVPLVTRLLYGGIAEELLMRWGLMSLLVWGTWRLASSREPVPAWCFWAGAAGAALLFALGHLPVLLIAYPDPSSALLAAVLAGNAAPGLVFGWLFWRRGIEAAMIAHALAHLFAVGAALLV